MTEDEQLAYAMSLSQPNAQNVWYEDEDDDENMVAALARSQAQARSSPQPQSDVVDLTEGAGDPELEEAIRLSMQSSSAQLQPSQSPASADVKESAASTVAVPSLLSELLKKSKELSRIPVPDGGLQLRLMLPADTKTRSGMPLRPDQTRQSITASTSSTVNELLSAAMNFVLSALYADVLYKQAQNSVTIQELPVFQLVVTGSNISFPFGKNDERSLQQAGIQNRTALSVQMLS